MTAPELDRFWFCYLCAVVGALIGAAIQKWSKP